MNILEKHYEDWICENIPAVVTHPAARLVGRQIALPSGGILDVLAVRDDRVNADDEPQIVFTVIEVKREVIDLPAITQILSYIGALGIVLGRRESTTFVAVEGVLAAPSITPEAKLALRPLAGLLMYVETRVSIDARPFEWFDIQLRNADDLARRLEAEADQAKAESGVVRKLAEAMSGLRVMLNGSGEPTAAE